MIQQLTKKKKYFEILSLVTRLAFLSYLISISNSECAYPYERCICLSSNSTPYCPCQYLTSLQTLNYTSTYYSHLTLINNFGCKPCDSGCQKCSNATICTQCLDQFQLINNQCVPCPTNCKACKNGVCSVCNKLFYINYQNMCEMCPLQGTNTCTIDSLTSCLSNYWLDNNGANCIKCDQNCETCSSTTKCSICKYGYYENNFKCYSCMQECKTCSNYTYCLSCVNQSHYFNTSTLSCQPCIANCLYCLNQFQCKVCNLNYYLNKQQQCVLLSFNQQIPYCQFYIQNSNSSQVSCYQCYEGYYMLNSLNMTFCYFGCSVLCLTCQGAHYGVCSSCVQNSILMNQNCLPKYNINSGTAFQRYYTALNNINIFQNAYLQNPNNCWHQHLITAKINNLSVKLSNLKSYKVQLQFKIYSLNNSSTFSYYQVTFNNNQSTQTFAFQFNISNQCYSNRTQCNYSLICIQKNTITLNTIRNQNLLTFQSNSSIISLSELLIIGYKCGGVYGDSCLQCSDINTCIKCQNPSFFIIGQRCIIQCPQNYYTYFAKSICYQLCPQGTYSDDYVHQCFACVYPCETCSSASKCITCLNNTYLNSLTKQCLFQCPTRYYPDFYRKTCQKCVFPCLQCSNSYDCLSCAYGFYQNQTFKCIFQCPLSYFANLQTRRCQKCQFPCVQCQQSQNKCRNCLSGYFLFQKQCLIKCPISSFQDFSNNMPICSKCHQNCLTCQISYDNCTSCNFGYFLLTQNNTCLETCPLSFYKNYLSLQCSKCKNQCLTCNSQNICSLCIEPYLYDQSTSFCLNQCPQYFYALNKTCNRCQLPCYECTDVLSCKSCYDSFLFYQTCINECPSGYYEDVQLLQCLKCDYKKCLQCQTNNSTCTKCSSGLLLVQGQCLLQCWINFYYSPYRGQCVLCEGLCKTCLNSTYCLSCINNFIFIADKGICVSTCSSGYYKLPSNLISVNQSLCHSCQANCLSCKYDKDSMKSVCEVCQQKFYLLNGSCYQNCPIKYFEFSQNYECYQCSVPCLSCKDQYYCESCLQEFGYYFFGECLASCPYRYYQTVNNNLQVCQQCDISCQFCQNDSQNCTSCQVSSFLIFQLNQNIRSGKCIPSCPKGYFTLAYDNICIICSQNCLTCNSLLQCTSCNDSSIQYFILHENSCISQCPSSYYVQTKFDFRQCLPCQQKCSICFDNIMCLQCQNDYFLDQNNLCVDKCPFGTFGQNFICKTCSYPCLTCNSTKVCTSCLIGLYYNGQCITQCQIGTYMTNKSICEKCCSNCSICISYNNCLFCEKGVLSQGICIQNCQKGYYQFYGACLQCSYGCSSCQDNHICNQCFQGFLYRGTCVQYCPNEWVGLLKQKNKQTNSSYIVLKECIKCQIGCSKCVISPKQCFQCETGLLLYINSCITDCPLGSYADYSLKVCQKCVSPCETCINSFSCQTCIYGYILYRQNQRNQCVEGPYCPNSYYLNLDSNVCEYRCSSNFLIEQKQKTCSSSCEKGFVTYWLNMSCLQFCPQDMWIDENYVCQNNTNKPTFQLPVITCQSLIIRNNLLIFCKSNVQLSNIDILTKESFSLSLGQLQLIQIGSSSDFCLVTSSFQEKIISGYLKLQFIRPYSLLSFNSIQKSHVSSQKYQSTPQTTFSNEFIYPVQNIYVDIFIEEFYYFTPQQRNVGMSFYQIGQSIAIGALIIWFFSLIKNLKSTNLLYILNLQWLYSVSLLSTNFPPHLNQFLEGLKFTNLYFIYASKQSNSNTLWNFSNKNISAFGINNLYNLNESLIPVFVLISFFLIIFIIMWTLIKILGKYNQNNQISNISDKAKIICDRFYYNYTFQVLLLSANPIILCSYLNFLNPTLSSFLSSLIFTSAYFIILIFSLYKYISQSYKSYRPSKYFFVQTIQIMIYNALIVMQNFYFCMGALMVLFTLKIFVWHQIFKKKQVQRCFHLQIIQIFKILVIIVFIIGEMKKQNWNSNQLYNYGFIQIFSCVFLIIISSIYTCKQLFSSEENKQLKQKNKLSIKADIKAKEEAKKKQNENQQNQQNSQQESQKSFFTNITPIQSDSSDEDIIDFDQVESNKQYLKRPAQLYRIDRNTQNL